MKIALVWSELGAYILAMSDRFFGALALIATVIFGGFLYFIFDGVVTLRERLVVVERDIKDLATAQASFRDYVEGELDGLREVVDRIDKRQASIVTPGSFASGGWIIPLEKVGFEVRPFDEARMKSVIEAWPSGGGIWVVATEPEPAAAIKAQYGPK